MANNTGVLLIFDGPDRTDINRVGAALGRGPESFTRKLTDEVSPTWEAAVSAWFAFQAGSLDLMSMWSGLSDTLPTLDDNEQPIVWENFSLTEVTAAAALADLSVVAVDTPNELSGFIADAVGGQTFDKRVVPDAEP